MVRRAGPLQSGTFTKSGIAISRFDKMAAFILCDSDGSRSASAAPGLADVDAQKSRLNRLRCHRQLLLQTNRQAIALSLNREAKWKPLDKSHGFSSAV
jgi:hypothetical protein